MEKTQTHGTKKYISCRMSQARSVAAGLLLLALTSILFFMSFTGTFPSRVIYTTGTNITRLHGVRSLLLPKRFVVHSGKNEKNTDVPNIITSGKYHDFVGRDKCAEGHISGYPPVCGADGCLRVLPKKHKFKGLKIRLAGTKFIEHVNKIDGWMHNIHIDLVSDLTVMQLSFGIHGSVGEIGVHHGKFSSVLAFNTQTVIGERFFVCDVFDRQEFNLDRSGKGNRGIFLKNMQYVGFSSDAKDESHRLRIWQDSSMYINKHLFLLWNLPAFRLISIDGSHVGSIVLNDLTKVLCVLREGGLVVMDDIFNNAKPEVTKALSQFFQLYGSKAILPLLFAENKLYLCTKNYYERYMAYLKKKLNKKQGGFKTQTTDILGPKFTFLAR